MIGAEFRLNQDEVKTLRQALHDSGRKAFVNDVKKGFNRASLFFIGDIQEKQMSGRPGLKAPTGTLRRSWFPETQVHGTDVTSRVLTEVKYARIHQYGGIIVPKNAQFLAFTVTNRVFASSLKTRQVREIKKARVSNFVMTKKVTIPKRLRVLEAFRADGLRYYVEAVREAINSFKERLKAKEAG